MGIYPASHDRDIIYSGFAVYSFVLLICATAGHIFNSLH